jgi:tRNA threonylcarbamoyladenosine biosynthesis protein TsaE
VTSPTYVLIQEYPARLPIFHFDAYRLRCEEEFLELGVEEYYAAEGVCLVEWADRVLDALPEQHLRIQLEVIGPHSRRATLTAFGNRYENLLGKV